MKKDACAIWFAITVGSLIQRSAHVNALMDFSDLRVKNAVRIRTTSVALTRDGRNFGVETQDSPSYKSFAQHFAASANSNLEVINDN